MHTDPPPANCELGHHGALVAAAPIETDTTVEVDFVCPACGAIEYTQSWGKAAWLQEQTRRTEAHNGVTDGR